MAKIEIQVNFYIDTDEYVEPTPKFEDDPRGFVKGVVLNLDLPREEDFDVFCPQLQPRAVAGHRSTGHWSWHR